jgi:hypothetical protein
MRKALRGGGRAGRRPRRVKPSYVVSQVPHRQQRYDTVGDWIPGDPVRIRVSRMKDERYVFLVALHEMIEYELCRMHGVTDREVVEFDVNFEKERRSRLHAIDAEAGDDPRAPYRDEHGFATMIERMVAQKMGVSWTAYENAVLSLNPGRRVTVRPMVRNEAASPAILD